MIDEIKQMHELVWRVRNELEAEGSNFTTPTNRRCVYYASGEFHEAFDIWMREENPAEARNNERVDTLADEFADCLMMVFTAIECDYDLSGELQDEFERQKLSSQSDEYRLNLVRNELAAGCLYGSLLAGFCRIVAAICLMYPDALQRIPHRLAKIVRKHGEFPENPDVAQFVNHADWREESLANIGRYDEKWRAILGEAYSA